MTPQPDAPDWRRLVSEAGADWSAVRDAGDDWICMSGASRLTVFQRGAVWHYTGDPGPGFDDPAAAIAAALNHLRAELRARMERDAAALKMLGGGE